MKTKKNKSNFLFKCFAFSLMLLVVSCSKDTYDTSSNENSALYKKVLADPLFENFDKAFYEFKINALKYSGSDSVDSELAENLKLDISNKKIKSYAELVERKEAIGYNDYEARSKVKINYGTAKLALMNKYPELAQNKAAFNLFLAKNSKYQMTPDIVKSALAENKNSRMYAKK